MDEVEQDTTGFTPILGLAEVNERFIQKQYHIVKRHLIFQASGFLAVILTGVWMGHYRGGFAWQADPKLQFNWHPLMMIMGMIFFYGNGALLYRSINLPFCKPSREQVRGVVLYRVFRHERKKKLKLAHACVMISALLFAVIGLKAVFDSHNLAKPNPIPNLYSLHSWIGIITVILFSVQWLVGLVTFLWPGLASHLRSYIMPIHVFFGMLIFILACASALTGITEKLLFSIKDDYHKKVPEGVMVNWIGILIILFGILVIYLVGNPRFKRLTRPEDEMLLTEATNE